MNNLFDIEWITIVLILILLFFFALLKEKSDHKDSYIFGIPKDKDSKSRLYKKIDVLSKSELTCVKWRRCYMTTIAIIIIISLIQMEIPTIRKLIVNVFVIFCSIYMMLELHSYFDTKICYNYISECISKIQKK